MRQDKKQIPPNILKQLNEVDSGLFIAMTDHIATSVNSLNKTIKKLDNKNSKLSFAIFVLSIVQIVPVIDILVKWGLLDLLKKYLSYIK